MLVVATTPDDPAALQALAATLDGLAGFRCRVVEGGATPQVLEILHAAAEDAVALAGGNKSAAALALGISRTTLAAYLRGARTSGREPVDMALEVGAR